MLGAGLGAHTQLEDLFLFPLKWELNLLHGAPICWPVVDYTTVVDLPVV